MCKTFRDPEFSCGAAKCIYNSPAGCKIVIKTSVIKLNEVGQCPDLTMEASDERDR